MRPDHSGLPSERGLSTKDGNIASCRNWDNWNRCGSRLAPTPISSHKPHAVQIVATPLPRPLIRPYGRVDLIALVVVLAAAEVELDRDLAEVERLAEHPQ